MSRPRDAAACLGALRARLSVAQRARTMKTSCCAFWIVISIVLWPLGGGAASFLDRDCLECHGDPALVQVLSSGSLRSIGVNRTSWDRDLHRLAGLSCVDCHSEANPYVHPRGGFERVDCSRCHPQECESFEATVHARRVGLTEKELPKCHDCHTKHEVRRKEDPHSLIHVDRIRETCAQCHEGIESEGIPGKLATFRVPAHRKQDTSMSFDTKVCIMCHQEDAVHGPSRLYNGVCNDCHKPRMKRSMFGVVGSTHLVPSLEEQPFTFGLKWLNTLVVLGILLGIGGLFVGRHRERLRTLFKRK